MRVLLLSFCCGLIFMLLQTTLFAAVLPPELRPNLLLILVVYLSLNESFSRAALLATFLGALQDVFSGTTLGLYAITQLMIFMLVRLFAARLNVESRRLLLILLSAGTLMQAVVIAFLLALFADAGAVLQILILSLPAQLLVNLLTGFVLLNLLLKVQPLLGTRLGMAGIPYQSKHHGA
ncbi:MAG: rod shape-determining protein MreD [Deltaproteobacteria bacterium]|nr:rod shape-determining protein MreD [Deltaproteobacteria bacterium]